jgi:hypothetical protein
MTKSIVQMMTRTNSQHDLYELVEKRPKVITDWDCHAQVFDAMVQKCSQINQVCFGCEGVFVSYLVFGSGWIQSCKMSVK